MPSRCHNAGTDDPACHAHSACQQALPDFAAQEVESSDCSARVAVSVSNSHERPLWTGLQNAWRWQWRSDSEVVARTEALDELDSIKLEIRNYFR